MRAALTLFAVHAFVLLAIAGTASEKCVAPNYFGICNPYVPGVFIGKVKNGAVPVFSTWYQGPAERAGICPGDSIIAVNGVSAVGGWDPILHELVSTTPNPVLLKVRRGKDVFDVRVRRVRETTLAARSGEKFGGVVVPVYATASDVRSVETFRQRLFKRLGFKLVDKMEVPAGTPVDRVQRLHRVLESDRAVKALVPKPNTYSAGFNIVVLKNPLQALLALILPGSPAQSAGLWVGDELATIDGQPVAGMPLDRMEEMLSRPGKIVLGMRRGGEIHDVKLVTRPVTELLGNQPDRPIPSTAPLNSWTYVTGITVLWDGQTNQAMLDSVTFPSPAFTAHLHPGSELVAINSKAVSGMTRDELSKLLSPTNSKPISLTIKREGKQQTARLVPVQYREALAGIGRKLTKFGPAPANCPD